VCRILLKKYAREKDKRFVSKCKVWRLPEAEVRLKYQAKVKEAVVLRSGEHVERVWGGLKDCLLQAADEVCGRTKGSPRRKESWWWHDEIDALVRAKRRLFREIKRSNTIANQAAYCNVKRERLELSTCNQSLHIYFLFFYHNYVATYFVSSYTVLHTLSFTHSYCTPCHSLIVIAHLVIHSESLYTLSFTHSHCTPCHSLIVIAHLVIHSQSLHTLSFTNSHCTPCHSSTVTSHFVHSLTATAHFVYSLAVSTYFVYPIYPLTLTYPPTLSLIYALISSLSLFLPIVSSTINSLLSVCVCVCECVWACVRVCV